MKTMLNFLAAGIFLVVSQGRCSGTIQLAAVNPRAKSDTSTSPQPQPATYTAGLIRFRKVSINDQSNMIGGEAFSFLAPADWQVDGGLVWRVHPTMPAAVAMRVRNPKGLEQLECFPTVAFSWGGYLAGHWFSPWRELPGQ